MKRRAPTTRETDPFSASVRSAERLVLASRSPRAATVGGEDSSIGDLLLAVIGTDLADALEQLSIDLEFAAAALTPDPRVVVRLPAATLLAMLARRAAAGAELHRRIQVARSGEDKA